MRSKFRLRLMFHTSHDMKFAEVSSNVKIDIEELKTKHYIFVITHINHTLILE